VPAGTVAVSVDWKVGMPLVELSDEEIEEDGEVLLFERLTALQEPEIC
jgi:hypothetical protein